MLSGKLAHTIHIALLGIIFFFSLLGWTIGAGFVGYSEWPTPHLNVFATALNLCIVGQPRLAETRLGFLLPPISSHGLSRASCESLNAIQWAIIAESTD